jgi:hypothetical protein
LITPSTVDEKKLFKVSELTDRDIGGSRGLKTFYSRDSDSDMCCLDHTDIVRSISDCEENCFQVLLDELDNESFLEWRYTT